MTETIAIADARARLSAIADEVSRTHDVVTITRNGEPAIVLLAAEDYESILETLAWATAPDAAERRDEAERSLAEGDLTGGDEMAELMRRRFGDA